MRPRNSNKRRQDSRRRPAINHADFIYHSFFDFAPRILDASPNNFSCKNLRVFDTELVRVSRDFFEFKFSNLIFQVQNQFENQSVFFCRAIINRRGHSEIRVANHVFDSHHGENRSVVFAAIVKPFHSERPFFI